MNRFTFISTMSESAWGGSEELWAQTASQLIAEGADVNASVLKYPFKPLRIEELQKAGCRFYFRQRGRVGRRLSLPYMILWLKSCRDRLVVLSQGGNYEGRIWMQACARLGVKYAVIVQAADDRLMLPYPIIRQLAEGYSKAEAVYFVSKANKELTEAHFGVELPQAKVISNPFTVPFHNELPYPATENGFRLAYVARFEVHAKGQDVLFTVLRQEKWRQRPLKVILYGRGSAEPLLHYWKEKFELDNVEFGGQIPDISKAFAENHALILPSRYEGLPLSLMEAMLSARTAIVSDVAGNCEVLEDNVTGFVAAAPTPKYLDEAMERAWQRRQEWEQIGKLAASTIRTLVPEDPIDTFAQELRRLADTLK